MSYFTIKKYNDQLYQIKDKLGVLSTLVIGNNKALLFDTGYGICSLKEEVKKLTNKELIVINSHGHMDHACGNYEFDEVYISKKDITVAKKYNSKKWRINNILRAEAMNALPDNFDKEKYINQNEGNLKIINEHDIIDLGNLDIEVINMEGHTAGSIGLYINKWRLLLASDAACPFVWLFLKESTTVKIYIKMLERVLKLDFDNFLVGHGMMMLPKQRMYEFLDVAKNIDLSKSVKVTFDQFEELNSYCYTNGTMYDQNDSGIVFDPNKM